MEFSIILGIFSIIVLCSAWIMIYISLAKQYKVKKKCDIYYKSKYIKYFGKFFKESNGAIVLKFHMLEAYPFVKFTDTYIDCIGISVFNKDNRKEIAKAFYQSPDSLVENKVSFFNNKSYQIDMSLNIPSDAVDENGELSICLYISGWVVEWSTEKDELVANWEITKRFD